MFSAEQNDSFAKRIVLTGPSPTSSARFTGATREPGEPHVFSGSLWWDWTAPSDQGMAAEITGSPLSPLPLIFTGDWPNLNLISAADDVPTSTKSFASFLRVQA